MSASFVYRWLSSSSPGLVNSWDMKSKARNRRSSKICNFFSSVLCGHWPVPFDGSALIIKNAQLEQFELFLPKPLTGSLSTDSLLCSLNDLKPAFTLTGLDTLLVIESIIREKQSLGTRREYCETLTLLNHNVYTQKHRIKYTSKLSTLAMLVYSSRSCEWFSFKCNASHSSFYDRSEWSARWNWSQSFSLLRLRAVGIPSWPFRYVPNMGHCQYSIG